MYLVWKLAKANCFKTGESSLGVQTLENDQRGYNNLGKLLLETKVSK